MSDLKATPGQWIARHDELIASSGPTVAIFLCCGDQVTNAANAHLMAASPKLYKSLESLVGLAKLGAAPIHQYQAAIKEAESVLAEARGKQ